MFAALFTIAGSFATLVLALIAYPYFKNHRLRKALINLPGPPVRSYLLGHLLDMPKHRSDRPAFQVKIATQYGEKGVMRAFVGPFPMLQAIGPKYIKEILSTSKHTTKNFLYDPLKAWLGLGLLTSAGEKWKIMRRLTTPAFHFEVLHRFLDVMNEQSEVMMARMDSHAGKNSFDVFDLITACALDIVCETAMGKKVGAQAVVGHTPYVQAVYDMSASVVTRFENPFLASDFVYSLTPAGRKNRRDLKILHDFTNSVIRERKALLLSQPNASQEEIQQRRPAFLDILLNAQAAGENITDENIREEVDTFMFEGHDTTSASMAWTLQLLGTHPEVQERLYKEIKEVMGDEENVTYDMLSQFKYLEMVLKESLRLYPSVPAIGRILTEDIEVEGTTVPAGTGVVVGIYTLHHNPNYWPEPEKFDPERWTPENSEGRDPYQYIPFSAGPRNCIGQKFAQNEERVIIAKIIKNFKITSTNPQPKMVPELILRPIEGIFVTADRRTA